MKTKYIHVYHPKVIHSDHSSLQLLHSRKDPNVGLVNGGYPQPLVNLHRKPELRITEEEYKKWRQEQFEKALEERKRHQEEQSHNEPDEVDEDYDESHKDDLIEEPEDNLYKKHKANKANSSSGRKVTTNNENHSYNQEIEATNSAKTYANYPIQKTNRKKPFKPSQPVLLSGERPRKNQPRLYDYQNRHQNAQASEVKLHFQSVDPTILDPTYYSTLPKEQNEAVNDDQDDIYSGLLSSRYNQKIADKSKLLGDINYNRKKQTKAVITSNNRRTFSRTQ